MTSRRASRIPHSWIWVMAALTVMHGVLTFAAGAAAQDAGLRIVVLEGEDSVNIIERGDGGPHPGGGARPQRPARVGCVGAVPAG